MSNFQYDRIGIGRRLYALRAVMFATFALLVTGLVFFQIIKSDEYVDLASQNRLRILRIVPPRGIIFDSKGAPLAVNVRTFNINGYPIDLQNDETAKKVVRILSQNGIPMTDASLKSLIERQYSAPYRAITVATNLTFAQIAEIVMDKDFASTLFLTQVWRRTYPAGEFAAHTVGYVAEVTRDELANQTDDTLYRGGDMIGKNGIEACYENILRGEAGEEVIEVDARGRKLRDISYKEPARGRDVMLTLDLSAQRYASELLGSFRGAIVALDVTDGSVKCLYSSPSYDPNPLTWGISRKEWGALMDSRERPMMNRAISGAYPPASTFKVVTASSGLSNNVINTGTVVRCPGYFELGGRKFRCWRHSGHGSENVLHALRDSCDVFFYQTASWLGIDRLSATAAKFGVGSKTGIDLTSESSGTLAGAAWKKKRIGESWYGGDTVNYGIGQGYVLMTPLQVAVEYASIASSGKVFRPKLYSSRPVSYTRLGLSPAILNVLQDGLREVGSIGTGRRASGYGVQVAGKTGTAQNSHGDDHAWFAGYAPADAPRYVVVAIAEAGKGGGAVTGPMVGKMLNYLVNGKKVEAARTTDTKH